MSMKIIAALAATLALSACGTPAAYSISDGNSPVFAAYAGPGMHKQEVYQCHPSIFGPLCDLIAIRSVPADQPSRVEYGMTPPLGAVGQVRIGKGGVSVSGSTYGSQYYSRGIGHADYHGMFGP